MKKIFFTLLLSVNLIYCTFTFSQMTPCNVTVPPTAVFDWPDYPGAISYTFQISTDLTFTQFLVDVAGLTLSQYAVPSPGLSQGCFYWRWRPVLPSGNGSWSTPCFFCVSPTGIKITSNEIPAVYNLYQNYPNPFNPNTNIAFDIAGNGKQSVSLIIYDILGNRISVIVNENLSPGSFEVTWDASEYTTGVYLYRLTSGDYSNTQKMVLLK
jgi:hypothetical protein